MDTVDKEKLNNKILCGIVTYCPDINRLTKNISAVFDQVDKAIVVDNGSCNFSNIISAIKDRADIIHNETNNGIAIALNQIVTYAIEHEYQNILFLDQDSVVPRNLIEEYKYAINKYPNSIICPYINYENGPKTLIQENRFQLIDWCITSGSFVSTETLKKVGPFDEKMFIDLVDLDICIRAKKLGINVVQDNHVTLDHELGNLKYIKIGKHILWIENHNYLRKYYIIRNRIYLLNKHNLPKNKIMNDIIIEYIKVLFFESDKIKKIKSMNKGYCDGRNMHTLD